MSQSTTKWTKRRSQSYTCLSGSEVRVRRPGPNLILQASRVARILQKFMPAGSEADMDKQFEDMEKLTDEELNKVMKFARPVIVDIVEDPPLVMNPQDGQLGPDDVPLMDFWELFRWAMNGGPDMPVKLVEGETTVEAVHTFPSGQESGDNASEDGVTVQ